MISSSSVRRRSLLRTTMLACRRREVAGFGISRSSDSSRMCSSVVIASHRTYHVHEYPAVLETQVRKVFGEIREVVADTGFHVPAEISIHAEQRAAAALVEIDH